MKDKNIIGDEQYRIKQRVCIIGLYYLIIYILEPNRRELTVIIRGPIHKPMKILVKASSDLPSVLKAASPAVTRDITNGPQRSHYF